MTATAEPTPVQGQPSAPLPGKSWEAADVGRDGEHVWFRWPRRVRLTIWRRTGAEAPLLAVHQSDVEVVDRACRHGLLPLRHDSIWAKRSVNVDFGANGTPVRISSSKDSALAAAAAAAAGVPAAVGKGAADAGGLLGAYGKAADWGLQQRRDQLQLRKDADQLAKDVHGLEGPTSTDPVQTQIDALRQQVTLAQLRDQQRTLARLIHLDVTPGGSSLSQPKDSGG